MVEEVNISTRHDEIEDIAEQVKDLLMMKLRAFLYESDNEEIRRESAKWRVVGRVKECQSVIRKANDVGIEDATIDIPGRISDFIGLRIVTKNKADAEKVFEDLNGRYKKGGWFCDVEGGIESDAKTIESVLFPKVWSGYQAFHMNFVYDSGNRYARDCGVLYWPTEIQITSELWAFYAEFSRRYFYKPEDPAPASLAPYIIPLSKILDAADDLVSNILEAKRKLERETDESMDKAGSSIESIRSFLESENRILNLYGTGKVPGEVFLLKMSELLQSFELELSELENIMSNEDYKTRYLDLLAASPGLYYLAPWQKTLAYVLMDGGALDAEIIERVNAELWHRGLKLRTPPWGQRFGYLMFYDSGQGLGLVLDNETRIGYYFNKEDLDPSVPDEILSKFAHEKSHVSFTLKRKTTKQSNYLVPGRIEEANGKV